MGWERRESPFLDRWASESRQPIPNRVRTVAVSSKRSSLHATGFANRALQAALTRVRRYSVSAVINDYVRIFESVARPGATTSQAPFLSPSP